MSPDNQPINPPLPQTNPQADWQQPSQAQAFNVDVQPGGVDPLNPSSLDQAQPYQLNAPAPGAGGPAAGLPQVGQPNSGMLMQPQPNQFQGPSGPMPVGQAQSGNGGGIFQMPIPPQSGQTQPQQLSTPQPSAMPQAGPIMPQSYSLQGPPSGPIQPQPGIYNAGPPFRPQKRRSKLLLPIVALVALVVLAGGGVAYMRLAGGPIKYVASDAVKYSTNSYDIAVPKQWSDQSNNTTFLAKVLDGDSVKDAKDLKTYAYDYDAKAQDAAAIIMAGYMETGASDDQLRQALASQADRDSFEAEMASAVDDLGSGGDGCESVTNKNTKTEYDSNGYIIRFVVSADCKIAAKSTNASGLKGDSAHMQVLLGAKNGKFYLSMLVTLNDDWQRNQAFYMDNIIYSLSPKS